MNNVDRRNDPTLNADFNMHMSTKNRLNAKTPYEGAMDPGGNNRQQVIRLINPNNEEKEWSDPLDSRWVYNPNTGKYAFAFRDMIGGQSRGPNCKGDFKYLAKNDKYNPEDRDHNIYEVTSEQELAEMVYPFIWSSTKNWFGINFVPPTGSKGVVCQMKQGMPYIHGFIRENHKDMYPVPKTGEFILKGYGNNYAHFRNSDKLDFKVWSDENKRDQDDSDCREQINDKPKISPTKCQIWLRLDANNRYVQLTVQEVDEDNRNDTYNKYNKFSEKPHGTHKTEMVIKPKGLKITSHELQELQFDEKTNKSSWNDVMHEKKLNTYYEQDEKHVMIKSINEKDQLESWIQQEANYIEYCSVDNKNSLLSKMYQNPGNIDTLVSNPEESTRTHKDPHNYTIETGDFTLHTRNNVSFKSDENTNMQQQQNLNVTTKQNYVQTVDQKATVNVTQDYNISVTENMNVNVVKDYSLIAIENVSVGAVKGSNTDYEVQNNVAHH